MINKDPFGGVSSELESNSPSPFKIDKEEALKQIQKSLELWDQKKVKKKSFLQRLREKNNQRSHPTQKPEALLYRILISSTNKGDIVLDPFLGSGTTAVVAKKL